jgi:ring-1,2-phenylacetyl-CoA epoxidase subunit PaaC
MNQPTSPPQLNPSRFDFALRLADNCLILGQRLAEWCGRGPELEEDMALTNIALDLIGQAQLWFEYASELDAQQRSPDALAFFRDQSEFRNVLLVEKPNYDFGYTITRQFYFDNFHYLLLNELAASADERIRSISEKALKEVTYHRRHSTAWVHRLGDGTTESHRRIQQAVTDLWSYTGELFAPDTIDAEMYRHRIAPDLSRLHTIWLDQVNSTLKQATLQVPESIWMQTGGKQGTHGESIGYLLAEMQFLQRLYPGAQW